MRYRKESNGDKAIQLMMLVTIVFLMGLLIINTDWSPLWAHWRQVVEVVAAVIGGTILLSSVIAIQWHLAEDWRNYKIFRRIHGGIWVKTFVSLYGSSAIQWEKGDQAFSWLGDGPFSAHTEILVTEDYTRKK